MVNPLNPETREEVAGFSPRQLDDLKLLGKTNLYFLSEGILGYNQLQPSAHAALCNFLDRSQSKRKMVLMPRGHLKSTICTVSRSIQKCLQNPDGYRALIANEVALKAQAFLTEIKQHWQINEMLRALWPELVPKKIVGPGSDWSNATATINRNSTLKESTWTTIGAGGSGAAWHFNHIIPDDLVGDQHKQSRADMERVKVWNRGLEALLDNLDTDEICWVGTRKTMDDVYADTMEQYEGELEVFIRQPIENGQPIFPLKFSLERFQQIMEKKPEEWAHDYMNNPVGKGGVDWTSALVQYYRWKDNGTEVEFQDAATGLWQTWRKQDLDITITCDPNSGKKLAPDKAAIIVHGVTPELRDGISHILVLEAWSDRASPTEFVDKIFDLALKWNARVVGIEEAGQQNTIHYFEKKCAEEGVYFGVQPLKHLNRDKETKIRQALDTPMKSRRLYLLPSMITLRSQLAFFPQLAAHNWDEIDALSYGPQVYRAGMRAEDEDRRRDAQAKILAARGVTGYGSAVPRRSHLRLN